MRIIGAFCLCMAVLAMTVPPAGAQSFRCDAVSLSAQDKLVVGAVEGGEGAQWPIIKRGIKAALNMRFQEAGVLLSTEADIVFCENRTVDDESAYDRSVSEALNDQRVLVEVGATVIDGRILASYVSIPMRHYEFFVGGNQTIKGFHQGLYGDDASPLSDRDLPDLFRDSDEIRVLTALALGLRYEKRADVEPDAAAKADFRDQARRFFCDAVGWLPSMGTTGNDTGLLPEEWALLGDYAKEAAQRSMTQALNDPAYEGALRVVADERRRAVGAAGAINACLGGRSAGLRDFLEMRRQTHFHVPGQPAPPPDHPQGYPDWEVGRGNGLVVPLSKRALSDPVRGG